MLPRRSRELSFALGRRGAGKDRFHTCPHAGIHSIPASHSPAHGGTATGGCGGCGLLNNQGTPQRPSRSGFISGPPSCHCLLGYSPPWGKPSLQPCRRELGFSVPVLSSPPFPWLMQIGFHNRCSEVRRRVTVGVCGAHSTTSCSRGSCDGTCECTGVVTLLPVPADAGWLALCQVLGEQALAAFPTHTRQNLPAGTCLVCKGVTSAEPLWEPGRLWQWPMHGISYLELSRSDCTERKGYHT